MTRAATADWDPGTYHRFRGLRLRPAMDLLSAVGPLPSLPAGAVVDLGCGSGAAGPALVTPGRRLIGIDSSPAMLAEAATTGCYDTLHEADIALWRAEAPVALIFSNAALHWLPDHAALLPRLVAQLAPGGVLAVQVPGQNDAPSHRCWRELAEQMFPGRLGDEGPGILSPRAYHALLAPLGEVSVWETTYWQELAPSKDAHPVRRFTESTYARPVLAALDGEEAAELARAYDTRMAEAYPLRDDGSALFPFRRLFFTLRRGVEEDF